MEARCDDRRERVRILLGDAAATLAHAGIDSPTLDAAVLLASALGVDRSKLHTGDLLLDESALGHFNEYVARRAAREPLAYIVGRKEFYGLEFEVNRDVLIPRPETELVVETALAVVRVRPVARILDLATGSGAIAIAIAVNAASVSVTATDISTAALQVARRNAHRHQCERRVDFVAGDCFDALVGSHHKFDLIVSNPPYIAAGELPRLEPEIARYEPEAALAGGQDGLDFYRRIARGAGAHLAVGGDVIVEVGAGQAGAVVRLLDQAGCRPVGVVRDLSGHERVVHALQAV
jgi:release factor glutamine methyltransferase